MDQAEADSWCVVSNAQFRALIATIPDAMVITDDLGTILYFSPAAELLFGQRSADVIGTNVRVLMAEPDGSAHDGYIARYKQTGERRLLGRRRRLIGRRGDGTVFPHDLVLGETLEGDRRLFVGFMRDLTEQEAAQARYDALQAEMIHTARISAMGLLAGALAHELNQPLTAVTSYVQTCAAMLAEGSTDLDGIRQVLKDAGAEALRAGQIVRRLREFISRGELQRTIEPLAKLVSDAAVLGLAGARERGIRLEIMLHEPAQPVLVDRVQIQQVIVNLLRNAIEAMDKGGVITIASAIDGELTRVTVTDEGGGIDPDSVDRLFDAFFSTKRSGMGLGLSICRSIIEAHGGRIWAEPAPGGGTRMAFTLPKALVEDGNGRGTADSFDR